MVIHSIYVQIRLKDPIEDEWKHVFCDIVVSDIVPLVLVAFASLFLAFVWPVVAVLIIYIYIRVLIFLVVNLINKCFHKKG